MDSWKTSLEVKEIQINNKQFIIRKISLFKVDTHNSPVAKCGQPPEVVFKDCGGLVGPLMAEDVIDFIHILLSCLQNV